MTPSSPPELSLRSRRLAKTVEQDARLALRTPAPVLISGGTSTEREAVARWMHAARAGTGTFRVVHCDQERAASLEAVLTGVRAVGTDYLDAIDALDREMQVVVSRFLELPGVGHVVAATGHDLWALTAGRFSRALFYRLNVIHLVLE